MSGMQYMGGKHYLKKKITAAILAHTNRRGDYHEPFIGGANMFEEIAPHFKNLFVSDLHEDLILLYSAVANGWDPPSEVSRELYESLRHDKPSALRGFVGFGVSYKGKWFGGYLADYPEDGHYYAAAAIKSLVRIRPFLQRASIQCKSFTQCAPRSNSVVYCDPPYHGTTTYRGANEFDHYHFWKIMQAWSLFGAHVFVSEYVAPEGWEPIWMSDHLCSVSGAKRSKRTEKLFVWKG
jgi:DNA adenine methylase